MNELEMRRALNRVKQYIAAKDYAKAKALLKRIEHPKQAQWLAQVETAERQYIEQQRPKPWDPSWISSMSIVMTPIIAGFILAWNWRRFGKGAWGISSALLQAGFFFGIFIFGYAIFSQNPQGFSQDLNFMFMLISPVVALAVFNFSFPFFIGWQQGRAFKRFKEKGYEAMKAYDYQWGRRTALYVTVTLLIAASIMGYIYYSLQPKNFEDEAIALTIESGWSEQSMRDFEHCGVDGRTCHLYIRQGRYGTEMSFQLQVTDWETGSSKELGTWIWDNIQDTDGYTPIGHGSYRLGEMDGYYLSYSNNDGYVYKDLVFAFGDSYLYITIAANSEESLNDDWDDIEAMLNTLVIK
jgi:hypothetical protein